MIKIIFRICCLGFLLSPHFCIAQNNQRSQIGLANIVPPSPEAAQIAKYGNIPVNHSTGAISIDVPIYKITTAQFKWPLSISYHASGIKVDEVSSFIGLGWVLNGMGVISRTIVGKPDEDVDGIYRNNIPYTLAEYNLLTEQQRRDIVTRVTAGEDSEPDIYSFNFNGLTGKFYLHRQKGVILQSEANLKIIPGGSSFNIIDDNGNTYYFTTYESTSAANYMLEYGWNGEPFGSGKTETHDGITGVYLTKVVSQDRSDSLQFIYGRTYTINQSQEQYSFKIGQKADFSSGQCLIGSQFPEVKKTNLQRSTTGAPVLTEILFSQGKVMFNYQYDREDMGRSMSAIGNQGRLTSVEVYKKREGNTFELFQTCRLYQSYFRSSVPSNVDTLFGYRLKLDSVITFNPNNQPMAGAFKFDYNNEYTLPYRTSCSQDYWGFYNGANNTNLMPRRIVTWNGVPYELGTANRESSPAHMQSSILKKVRYPTGGFSIFDYEPHKYWDPNLTVTPENPQYETESLTATPGQQTHNPKKRFYHQTASQTVPITAFFKAWYGKSDRAPYVAIREVLNNNSFQNVLTIEGTDPHNDKYQNQNYTLVQGKQYEIEAYVHAGSWPVNEVWSSISLSHIVSSGEPGSQGGYRIIGGLRIKSIINCTAEGDTAAREIYAYGASGEGTLITDLGVFKRDYRTINERALYFDSAATMPCYTCPFSYRMYTEQSPYSLGTISGSPIAYSSVVKMNVDRSGKPLGMELFQYNILNDSYDVLPETGNYYPISYDWKNGKLNAETLYVIDSAGNPFEIKKKEYTYQDVRSDTVRYLMISKKYPQYCTIDMADFTLFQARYYAGKRLPLYTVISERSKSMDGSILLLSDTTYYEYSPTSSHNNPIAVTRKSSENKIQKQRYYYPQDMVTLLGDNGGGIHTSMIEKGITGPLILQRDSSAGIRIFEQRTEFASPYNTFIKPIKTYSRTFFNPLELDREVKYATTGQTIEQTLRINNVRVSYLWDYFQTFPVAEVTNATSDQIAYTSFEADGKGGFSFNGTPVNDMSAPTGNKAYSFNGSNAITKSGLTNTSIYTVSYWTKNASPFTIAGTQAGFPIQVKTIGAWKCFEHRITGQTQINITASTGVIDEIRLYPVSSKMNTYTYEPLKGMSSSCDEKNSITYYEYDAFGRLLIIRDENKNVLKKFCYNYAGQSTNCY